MPAKSPLPLAPLLTIVMGAFMIILDTSIVNIAITKIMSAFGTSVDQVQWIVTVYILTLAVVVPLSNWLGVRFGYKRVYMFSLILFIIGSALCGLSWNIQSMIFFRAFQALGGGMVMPVTMTMLYRLVPRERIGEAMGIWGVAAMAAPALGPSLGGYLVQYVDWRYIFYINLPVGIIGLFLAQIFIPGDEGHSTYPFDLPGFLTSGSGLFTLLYAFSEGQKFGWNSEIIVSCFYVSVCLLALFVFIELESPHPLIDLRVFTNYNFTLSNILLTVTVIGMYAGIFYMPLFLQTIQGLGALQTGLILMPAGLAAAVAMPISGKIYDRYGPLPVVAPGLLILAVMTYLFHNMSTNTTSTTIDIWLSIRSLGMGLAMMPITTAGMSLIPNQQIGSASALSNIVRQVGASFGLAILTSLLQGYQATATNNMTSHYTPGSFALTHAEKILHGTPSNPGFLVQLYGLVQKQSFILGVDHIYEVTAIITLAGAIMGLFLHAKRGPKAMAPTD